MSIQLKVSCISDADYELCMESFAKVWVHLGEVVLYTWIEWLKEQQHLWAPTSEADQVPFDQPDSGAELADAVQQVGSCSSLHQQFHLASILGSMVWATCDNACITQH